MFFAFCTVTTKSVQGNKKNKVTFKCRILTNLPEHQKQHDSTWGRGIKGEKDGEKDMPAFAFYKP
jgi:hypothetical protein